MIGKILFSDCSITWPLSTTQSFHNVCIGSSEGCVLSHIQSVIFGVPKTLHWVRCPKAIHDIFSQWLVLHQFVDDSQVYYVSVSIVSFSLPRWCGNMAVDSVSIKSRRGHVAGFQLSQTTCLYHGDVPNFQCAATPSVAWVGSIKFGSCVSISVG